MRIAELTPVYKRTNHPSWALRRLTQSDKIYEFARDVIYTDENGFGYDEKFYAIYLNNSMSVLSYEHISTGGLTETLVDLRKVFQGALLCSASVIVLVHNHPSGSLVPSRPDKVLTETANKACGIMSFLLADHVIVSDGGYYSFHDEGAV